MWPDQYSNPRYYTSLIKLIIIEMFKKKGSIHRKSRSDLNEIDLQILAGIGLIGVITFKVSNMYSTIMYAEN